LHFNIKNDDDFVIQQRLAILDTIKVDDHQRLTFTKRIRDVFPIKEGDIISVYRDSMDKHNKLVFKIQRDDVTIDTFILKRDGPLLDKNFRKNLTQNSIRNEERINGNGRAFNILLVEDEEDLLFSINETLTSEGYNVKSFSDPRKALYHLIEKHKSVLAPYDLIVTDIRMPNINGIQLYQILMILDPLSNVLFMTGLDAIDELSSLMPAVTPRDILRKPFGNQYLIQKIKEKMSY
jgi:CheY-like chemotaxis protein